MSCGHWPNWQIVPGLRRAGNGHSNCPAALRFAEAMTPDVALAMIYRIKKLEGAIPPSERSSACVLRLTRWQAVVRHAEKIRDARYTIDSRLGPVDRALFDRLSAAVDAYQSVRINSNSGEPK